MFQQVSLSTQRRSTQPVAFGLAQCFRSATPLLPFRCSSKRRPA